MAIDPHQAIPLPGGLREATMARPIMASRSSKEAQLLANPQSLSQLPSLAPRKAIKQSFHSTSLQRRHSVLDLQYLLALVGSQVGYGNCQRFRSRRFVRDSHRWIWTSSPIIASLLVFPLTWIINPQVKRGIRGTRRSRMGSVI
jgi:hypothetical protein